MVHRPALDPADVSADHAIILNKRRALRLVIFLYATAASVAAASFRYFEIIRGIDDNRNVQVSLAYAAVAGFMFLIAAWDITVASRRSIGQSKLSPVNSRDEHSPLWPARITPVIDRTMRILAASIVRSERSARMMLARSVFSAVAFLTSTLIVGLIQLGTAATIAIPFSAPLMFIVTLSVAIAASITFRRADRIIASFSEDVARLDSLDAQMRCSFEQLDREGRLTDGGVYANADSRRQVLQRFGERLEEVLSPNCHPTRVRSYLGAAVQIRLQLTSDQQPYTAGSEL